MKIYRKSKNCKIFYTRFPKRFPLGYYNRKIDEIFSTILQHKTDREKLENFPWFTELLKA